MVSSQLSQLQAACNKAHQAYMAARNELAAAINASPDSEVVADIAASADFYGLNATIKRVTTSDPKVAQAITKLVEAADHHSLAVSDRELFLMEQNPNHQRTFVTDGREYRVDVDKGLITYVDDPNNPEKVNVQKLDKLPYYDLIEAETPLIAHTSTDDEDDDDDSPKRRKGKGR
jgi:hypothetical protein